MEAGSEGEKKKPPEGGEPKPKRKMKTAYQLDVLENTYAVETYPSEALRADLSAKLGLTDRQLQMWFCHRRLKDRKAPPVKRQKSEGAGGTPNSGGIGGDDVTGGELGNEHGSGGSGSGSSPFGHGGGSGEARRVAVSRGGVPMSRIASDVSPMRRYYEPPQQSVIELRAIAFVEAQLGERLREDGPILGMEFDPLPPDAFGAPLAATVAHQRQGGKPYTHGGRALQEYQFLPEQPTVRNDPYERVAPSHYYNSPAEAPSARSSSIPPSRSFMHVNEQTSSSYSYQGQMPSLKFLSQQGRQGHLLPSASGDYDSVPRKSSYPCVGADAQFGGHPISGIENPFVSHDTIVMHDDDVARMDRKRKSEEARIAKEVEAHEKRIRKELEKQDILRRKREEQMRKEMERQDRERRKEEERLLREKQREEERFQREQRRELERKEKFLQKESIRAEKLRRREELRRGKEAARLKAANERATARRIAKESMELIEDERLELMELAASSKGFLSILSLDSETLQNLELFRDKLSTFPPLSVQLKKPYACQPWTDSDENIGNLLMVWKFLITFADVLGLWPFTLDEFVQAFHDHDSRLLGEIHIALLKSIIKDIEDVARTPANVLGTNQYTASNPGGGHPQIVDGAYAWGFDICSWQCHLSPLTWPEILRQFALSAGFGPKLKKRNIEQSYFRDDNEGNDCEDVISTLRNGVAVENAVAIMQERGYSNPRRSRHRLTPGTVKFAAFHVLSLEGEKGLTILEVADRIQKSGLRDLTTSKTPEASIAAALSRDTILFERTAPSTYCVRAPYRKDPADAESILSAAREKIQVFKSGFVEGDDADDVERDEESESDGAEDPEIDDLGTELNSNKDAVRPYKENILQTKTCVGNGKETIQDEVAEAPQSASQNAGECSSSVLAEGIRDAKATALVNQAADAAGVCNRAVIPDQGDTDIDESHPGEPWVQGLVEGEYSDLSVDERLKALVALIGVANEGNSMRVVLEERLEAANALKKQMWAEAQLDKRRMKEEIVTKVQHSASNGTKVEPNYSIAVVESRQSLFVADDNKNNEASISPTKQEMSQDLQNDPNYQNNLLPERVLAAQDLPGGVDNFLFQQSGYAAEKSRSQLKAYIGHKAEEMYVYRSLPLGLDRRRNRYWQFITSTSIHEPGSGRIFIELHDGCWRLIDSEEGFDGLLASLDPRGLRESHLHSMLQRIESSFKESVRKRTLHANIQRKSGIVAKSEGSDSTVVADCSGSTDSPSSIVCVSTSDGPEPSSSFTIELGKTDTEKRNSLKRFQDFQKWMWKVCFNPSTIRAKKYGKKRCMPVLETCEYCHDLYSYKENHCPSCHKTYGTSSGDMNFSEHVAHCEVKMKKDPDWTLHGSDSPLPPRIRILKAQLALIEVSIPPEACQSVWTESYRDSWGLKLHSSSSAEDLLQILTVLEAILKGDFLSSNFETTNELLGSSNASESAVLNETVRVLPWIPQTAAAVALRLLELDASISYMPHQKVESLKDKAPADLMKISSKYALVKKMQENEPAEALRETRYLQQENWINKAGDGQSGLGRAQGARTRGGRGGRTRGTRSQRKVISGGVSGKKGPSSGGRLKPALTWATKARGRGGHKRGRRSVRSWQKPVKRVVEIAHTGDLNQQITLEKSPASSVGEEWNGEDTMRMQVESGENSSSSGRSDYDDENGQASGNDYDDMVMDGYGRSFNGKSTLLEGCDYNMDAGEDEGDYIDDEEGDIDGGDDDQGGEDIEGYINGDTDEEERDVERNGDPDVGSESESSEYSD
ncbi:WHIM2 domain [Dillenia turbinata]|uniref:WHIM2 domain n=1 Tax=Dillenia turbinata TaxID=194707 RepID=A0AAN8UZ77_9MAGN